MLKAVLFDMDGVLLESEEFINRAGVEMFREKGFEVNPEDFLPLQEWEKTAIWGVLLKNTISRLT